MGSDSDLPVMKAAAEVLDTFNVAYEVSKSSLFLLKSVPSINVLGFLDY
jgi:hypothetical protein